MIIYGDMAPNMHRLYVRAWNDTFNCHECVVEGSTRSVFVDLFISGEMSQDIDASDLIGKMVEVAYTHGFLWIAAGPRVLEDEEVAA